MLFEKRLQDGLKDGSISLAFRRWRRPQVVARRQYRSPIGMVEVSSVSTVDANAISTEDAEQAGFASRAALLTDLPGEGTDGTRLYRVELRLSAAPDPRDTLASKEKLSHEDIQQLDAKLARLDRERTWTHATLAAIARQPGRRAGDLAEQLGWAELQDFKLHVRRLKDLGLTLSLRVGYQLSPRGEAYLASSGAGQPLAASAGTVTRARRGRRPPG